MPGTWKQIDLPPPVGSNANVSLPSKTDWIIASCEGRKFWCFQYFANISFGLLNSTYTTFLKLSLTELIARTTSLSPIAKALKLGLKNPKAAIGMATTL